MPFAKNMGKNFDKNISKNLSGKHSQKLFDHTKQSSTDAPKTPSKTLIQKTAETFLVIVISLLIKLRKSQ